jgi:integrase
MLERRCKAADIGVISAHQFRRGLATQWLARGGSEIGLMRVAGWSSTRMVDRYTRARDEELALAEAVRVLS